MGQIRFSSPSIPVKSVSDWPVTNSVGGVGGTTGWVAFLTRFSCFLTHLGLLLLSFCGLSSFLSHLANMSSLAPSLLDLMSGRPSEKAMPKVTDSVFFGHQFKWDGHMYTICRKTASKRGGTSWIWRYGTELRQVGNLSKKAWLCCICWDRKVVHPLLAGTLVVLIKRWTNNSTLKFDDQWKHYTTQEGHTATRSVNVFHWWRDNGKHLPAVQQMAYDLLAIPAMSSEVERAFSGARNTMDDHRTRLGAAIFEMTELEKQWMRAGLGDDLGPSGDLAGYLTPDGKAVLEKVLWGKEGRPKDLDEDVEPV